MRSCWKSGSKGIIIWYAFESVTSEWTVSECVGSEQTGDKSALLSKDAIRLKKSKRLGDHLDLPQSKIRLGKCIGKNFP